MGEKGGFTLIELMVVIAIIAILSGIILASFSAAKAKSRDGQRISDTAQIQLALAGYFNQCNAYPSSLTIPSGSTTDPGCPSGVNLGTFISKIPTPPTGANQANYVYLTATSNSIIDDYMLEATLEGNSTVSSESLSGVPSDISAANGSSANYTCTGVQYCLGPK